LLLQYNAERERIELEKEHKIADECERTKLERKQQRRLEKKARAAAAAGTDLTFNFELSPVSSSSLAVPITVSAGGAVPPPQQVYETDL
jgi:hypothetical protein